MATVKVAVRVRPFNQRELDMGCQKIVNMEGKKTRIVNTKIAPSNLEGDIGRERIKEFSFDFSHCSFDYNDKTYASQEQVFSDLGTDVVDNAFEGYNACVFAYGQTGSGKTYTMMGSPDCAGLIPRICQNLFERMKKDKDAGTTYRTEVSYLEIYNEKVKDLLKQGSDQHNLRVREHPRFGPYVQDLSKHLVMDYSDIYELMMKGNSIRTTASTNMNDVSSRSHAIFTITFVQAKFSRDAPSETVSKVNLVDLAGSERADASGATGQRLKEGGHINKSLVTLGSVISALADMSSASNRGRVIFIPYRDSVLTWLLKDSLGGNSKTIMIAAISPADVNYGETLSTLRYANRAKNIVNKPTINEDPNVKLIRDLRSEIAHLRSMLGNEPKIIDSNQMVMKLHANEAKVRILTEEWAERWRETQKILQEQQTLALRKSGVGVVLDSDRPHLVGLDDSVFSTGITFYPLKEGQTLIGGEDSSEGQDIVLTGEDLQAEHCIVELSINGDAMLIPLEQASCYIDTVRVEKPTKLDHGCVILLGRNNMFRFNDPAEAAKLRKEKERGSSLNLSRLSFLSWSTPDLARPVENDNARFRRCFEEAEADSLKTKQDNPFKNEAMPSRLHELEIESIQEPNTRNFSCTLGKAKTDALKLDDIHSKEETPLYSDGQQHLFDRGEESFGTAAITPESNIQREEPEQILDKEETGSVECFEQNQTIELDLEKPQTHVEDKAHQKQHTWEIAHQDLEQERLRLTENFDTKMEELQTRLRVLAEQEELLHQSSAFHLAELQREQDLLQRERKNEIMKVQKETKDADLLKMELYSLQQFLADAEADLSTDATVLNRETLLKNLTSYQQTLTVKIQELQKEILSTSTHLDAQLQDFQNKELKLETRLSTPDYDDEDEKLTIEIELSLLRKEKDNLRHKITEQEDQNQVKLKELNAQLSLVDKKCHLVQSYVTCCDGDKNEVLDDIRSRIDVKQNALSSSLKKITDSEILIANIDTERQRSGIMLQQKAIDIARDKAELEQLVNLHLKLNEEATAELESRKSALDKNLRLDVSCTDQTSHMLTESLTSSGAVLSVNMAKSSASHPQGKNNFLNSSLQDHSSLYSKYPNIESPVLLEEIALSPIEQTTTECRIQTDQNTQARSPNSYSTINKVEDYFSHFSSDMLRDSSDETHWKDVDRRILELQHLQEQYSKLEEEFGTTGMQAVPSPEKTQHCNFFCKRLFEEDKLDRLLANDNHHQSNGHSSQSGSSSPSRSSRTSRSPSLSTRDLLSPSRAVSPVGQFEEVSEGVYIAVPSFVMRGSGSTAHFEYEIKVIVMSEKWTIFRRYKRIRELHLQMRQKYGAKVSALNFPSRRIFGSNSEKNAEERRQQLQTYFQKLLSLCLSLKECPLYAAESVSKQLLCDVIPFFRKGAFETSKWATG